MKLNFQYPDDVVRGCVKYLLSLPDVTSLVGQFDSGQPFIFEGAIGVELKTYTTKLPGNPVTALVVKSSGSWGTPAPQSTERYPKISVEVWSDPPRNTAGMVTRTRYSRVAADYLYQVMDSHLNFTASDTVMFGTQPVWRSYRLGEISYLPQVASDDGLLLGEVAYGLQTAYFAS
jgi:hypothetical protein